MKWTSLLTASLLLVPVVAAAQQKRPLTPRDLYKLRVVSDVTVSPDGKSVVFVQTSIDSAGNRYVRDLWLASADGTAKRRLTWTPQSSEGSPVFSPDGKSIAFVSKREGDERAAEIYVLPFNEPGEARRVTSIARGASAPVWSPDGKRIAFSVSDSVKTDSTRSDPHVVTRMAYVAEQALNDERWGNVYVVDAWKENAVAQRITRGEFGHNAPTWTRDGRSIVFSATPPKGKYHPDYEEDGDLFTVLADTGAEARVMSVSTSKYGEGNAGYSLDGAWLAYVRQTIGDHQSAANNELMVARSDGTSPVCVSCALDRSAGRFDWDAQGRVYFTVPDRGGVHLYRASAKDGWKPQALITGARGILSYDVNGSTIAWAEMNPERPSDLYASDSDGLHVRRLTTVNDSLLAAVHVMPYEEVWYAAQDGAKLQGWIVRPPPGVTPKRRLALEMHGGPHVMWGPGEASMWLEYQSLAADGYTVFFANPRGSDGYGFEFKKAIHRNWGDLPMGDVLAGVDTVLQRGLADRDKQYITGGSYAGYLTAWIIGHTNRFKAAAAQRGVYDMVSWWGMANTYRLFESEFAIKPWEDAELAWKSSPIAYAAKMQTPLLLLHGEQDYRVGLGGVQTLYRMLKSQGKEVQLVLYPREGHEVTRSGEPKHRVDHMQRIINWFDAH